MPLDSPISSPSLRIQAVDPFRLLVESVTDFAIFMLDPHGLVASWNPGAQRIYGYRAEDIIGRPFTSFYSAEAVASGAPDHARTRAIVEGHFEQEDQRLHQDGSTIWAVVTLSELKDASGKHTGFSVVTRDVTERKQLEEAVRGERDLSATILRNLPGIYYVCNAQGGFLSWNWHLEDVSGYSSDEIRQLDPLDLFASEDRRLVADAIDQVFRSGESEVEANLVSKSGGRTRYLFNGVRTEVEGEPCLLGMGLDISARKRAEQSLRATDERQQLSAISSHVGLWDWDLHTDEVFYSAEWRRQLGYETEELCDDITAWQRRLHPEDLDATMAGMRAFIADPSMRYEAEFRLRHRDDSYRIIISQAVLLMGDDQLPIRMLGWHVDVTDQRMLERQAVQTQKMEAIGQLAGGVAHDFNNLLTVINGNSELLLDRLAVEDPLCEMLLEIRKAGDRAATLTRQLLAFSRQQVLALQVLNLNVVVADTERMLHRLIGEDIVLTTTLSPVLGLVMADPGQLEQVLINLVVNARDAIPPGGSITVETRSTTLDENYCRVFPDLLPGNYVVVSVSDTGHGMDQMTQQRIFEPFFTTKGAGQGTGLGLATVHGIVKQSRGHVAVYSEVGHGTTFKVYLPEVDGPPVAARVEAQRRTMPRGTEVILLAEDEPAVRTLATHILTSCGYTVHQAANGREAIAFAETFEGSIDLLISDVVMPHVGGRELATRFAKMRPDSRLLFLSGYADDAVIRHGVLEAEYAFLQKPFTPSSLAHKVRAVLNAAEPARAM